MQRNKSKKFYSSFHKAQARLADPCKSQIIYKNKNQNHINFQSVKRVGKQSYILYPHQGRSLQNNKSISKSTTARNLKVQKDKKTIKQIGCGLKGNGPLSNRILKQLTNLSQRKKIQDVKQNMNENKRQCIDTNNRTIQSTANNKVIQQFSPLTNECLQIQQFVADFNIQKSDRFSQSKLSCEQGLSEQQKQHLLIRLEELNVEIQEFRKQNQNITQSWIKIIGLDKEFIQYQDQIQKMNGLIKDQNDESNKLKTQLFNLNREFISDKKMKDFKSKNNRENILTDAENIHEDLRKKLSSKADYQHIILFNQKVILSGQVHSTFSSVYREMFENQLAKKYALIVKKQLSNLANYEIKLVQQYLKKIQELEYCYIKVDQKLNNQNQSVGMDDYLSQLQRLVENIQQKTIKIQKMKSYLIKYEQKKDKMGQQLQQNFKIVDNQLIVMSTIVSEEYQKIEGKQFDFKIIIQGKFKQKFKKFKIIFYQKQEIQRKLKNSNRK